VTTFSPTIILYFPFEVFPIFTVSSKMNIKFTNKTIRKIGLCRCSRFGLRSPCSCSPRAVMYLFLVLFLLLLALGFHAPVARCPISAPIANVISLPHRDFVCLDFVL
jgi:hypothetical protein